MKRPNWFLAGLGAACLTFVGLQGLRYERGIPVEPVAVADFNGNGSEDAVLSVWSSGGESALEFIDGVEKRGGQYFIHMVPAQTGIKLESSPEGYNFFVGDINSDGKQDLSVFFKGLEKDPTLYMHTRKDFLGRGDGTFYLAPDLSHGEKE